LAGNSPVKGGGTVPSKAKNNGMISKSPVRNYNDTSANFSGAVAGGKPSGSPHKQDNMQKFS